MKLIPLFASLLLLGAPPVCADFPGPGVGADAGDEDGGQDSGYVGHPNPQEAYTYPGCDDAGTYGCPRSLVFGCAMRTIREKYDSCTTASDCVDATLPNCVSWGHCPPVAVSADGREAYQAEAQEEISRYCDGGQCAMSGSCAWTYNEIACVDGRCRWQVDAGS